MLNPSAIDDLELKLAKLANLWRTAHSQGNMNEAENIIQSYHTTMDDLWEKGWDDTELLPDSELPIN